MKYIIDTDKMEIKKYVESINVVYSNPTNSNSSIREQIVAIALKYLEGKYNYGKKDMSQIFTIGVDCSGFTQGVYKEAGISVPSYAVNSIGQREWGKETKTPRPGDLICYEKNEKGIGHVAIYIGNNEIVNCGSTPIKVMNAFYRPINCIRNLIGD